MNMILVSLIKIIGLWGSQSLRTQRSNQERRDSPKTFLSLPNPTFL